MVATADISQDSEGVSKTNKTFTETFNDLIDKIKIFSRYLNGRKETYTQHQLLNSGAETRELIKETVIRDFGLGKENTGEFVTQIDNLRENFENKGINIDILSSPAGNVTIRDLFYNLLSFVTNMKADLSELLEFEGYNITRTEEETVRDFILQFEDFEKTYGALLERLANHDQFNNLQKNAILEHKQTRREDFWNSLKNALTFWRK